MVTLKEDKYDLEEIQKPDLSILDYVPVFVCWQPQTYSNESFLWRLQSIFPTEIMSTLLSASKQDQRPPLA